MTQQLELDINRPAWHDINYEPVHLKNWVKRNQPSERTPDPSESKTEPKVRIIEQAETRVSD